MHFLQFLPFKWDSHLCTFWQEAEPLPKLWSNKMMKAVVCGNLPSAKAIFGNLTARFIFMINLSGFSHMVYVPSDKITHCIPHNLVPSGKLVIT